MTSRLPAGGCHRRVGDVHVGADRVPAAEEAVGPLEFLLDLSIASSSLIARTWRSAVCTRLTTTL
jgi:hypothetical protein